MGLGGVDLLELHLNFDQNQSLLSVNSPRFSADPIKIKGVYSLYNYYYLVFTM